MGAYAMGAPWLRFDCDDDCGHADGAPSSGCVRCGPEMTGKTPDAPGQGPHGRFGGPGFGGHGFGGPPWARGMRGPKARRGDVRAAILSVLSDAAAQRLPGDPGDRRADQRGLEAQSRFDLPDPAAARGRGTGGPGRRRRAQGVRADRRGSQLRDRPIPDEMAAPWAAMAETDADGDLRPMLGQVAAAMWQVMAVGSPEQQAAARDAVVDLRKTLYGILAEGADEQPTPTGTGDEQGLAVRLAVGLQPPAPGAAVVVAAAAAAVRRRSASRRGRRSRPRRRHRSGSATPSGTRRCRIWVTTSRPDG